MNRRNTNQKIIVLSSLEYLGHATSETLIEYINNNYAGISLATIYRNLSVLLDDGVIKRVKLGNIEVYETVKPKHYHFKCKKCGEVIDILPEELPYNFKQLNNVGNNKLEDIDVLMHGICFKCK